MLNTQAEDLKNTLNSVHRKVLDNFIEKSDRGEHWQMPPDGYDGTQTIKDDCDGFCLAVRKLLRELNIKSRLVYCEINRSGHLVVEVDGWVLDNRQNRVVANTLLTALGYKFIRISGYSPGEPWREVLLH